MSAAACIINAAFGWFILPESLSAERRMAFAWKRANPIGSLRLLLSHRQLTGLAVVDLLANVAHQVLPSVFVLYAAYRYGWGEAAVGLTLAFVGVCSAIVQGLLIGPIVARIGGRLALMLGLLAGGLGMAIYGLAPTRSVVLSRRTGHGALGSGWSRTSRDGEPAGQPLRTGATARRL